MIYSYNCASLAVSLEELKKIVAKNEKLGVKTTIFCEDRLTLVAERAVCAEVGGTFLTSVCTLARFLATEGGRADNVLSGQGSAMAVRRIIEEHKSELPMFKKLSASSASETVYDTIALFYSSKISPEDAKLAGRDNTVLGGKLHDIAIIYDYYEQYLKENCLIDRNVYLKRLSSVIAESPAIRGGAVIFLGFQAFTGTTCDCVRSAFGSAESVYGLFIGGAEDAYVNEASTSFLALSREFGGAQIRTVNGSPCAEADILRKGIFNPESFYAGKFPTDKVALFEAQDGEEELEFVASQIKKHIATDVERYHKISVMLPDLEANERALQRVFARYGIPYYADRQFSLGEHPLCAFVIDLLLCVSSGFRPEDTDRVISSPYFPAELKDKDIARNYLLRLAKFRGGIKREPDPEILKNMEFDFEAVQRVRKTFLDGAGLLNAKGGISGICGGVRRVFELYGVENKCEELYERYKNERPAQAQFCARAGKSVLAVLEEADSLVPNGMPLAEFIKILKSGFSAMKISLIPPKSDAVFVGDIASTANAGSEVVFACRLTGDVPCTSSDTSFLTDRDITALERVNLNISPKIRQVNARRREICALNCCAFKLKLYLSYPARAGGEECGESEIISYARALFCDKDGAKLSFADIKSADFAYLCAEKLPALKFLRKNLNAYEAPAVYTVLCENGYKAEADACLKKPEKRDISCGQQLYLRGNSLSPTTLETYFSCPYLGFIRQGLKVREREEGAVRAVDTGNFIHAVLEDCAHKVSEIASAEEFADFAKSVACEKLSKPPYSALADSAGGEYLAGELIEEAVKVSSGMYSQLVNSSFKVSQTECSGELYLKNGVKLYGRIDRVDESGEMVRVIDYKTGTVDSASVKYYMGAKLQLPLYLLSASKDKRPAGAYYFPATVEYREKEDGIFRLQGFMDCSDDVVTASDKNVQPKQKSEFVNAYYQGRKSDSAMPREDFGYFLRYSCLVAQSGAEEMLGGNISPSPAEGTCKYCKAGGSCFMSVGKDGAERKGKSVKCSQIAEIVRKKENGDATD